MTSAVCNGHTKSKKSRAKFEMVFLKDVNQSFIFELRLEKTGLRDFRAGPMQTGLYSHRRRLEAGNFGFKKKRVCTIRVAKTKAMISFTVTAKLILHLCYLIDKIRFSHEEVHLMDHM